MTEKQDLVRVIALAYQRYGGREYFVGDVIEMPEADVRDLEALRGKVKRETTEKKRTYKRRDMQAE